MDIDLHYEARGSGKPLILLHGNGESSAYFEKQLPVFAKHFHVFAVDTRGHGQSPRVGSVPSQSVQSPIRPLFQSPDEPAYPAARPRRPSARL